MSIRLVMEDIAILVVVIMNFRITHLVSIIVLLIMVMVMLIFMLMVMLIFMLMLMVIFMLMLMLMVMLIFMLMLMLIIIFMVMLMLIFMVMLIVKWIKNLIIFVFNQNNVISLAMLFFILDYKQSFYPIILEYLYQFLYFSKHLHVIKRMWTL